MRPYFRKLKIDSFELKLRRSRPFHAVIVLWNTINVRNVLNVMLPSHKCVCLQDLTPLTFKIQQLRRTVVLGEKVTSPVRGGFVLLKSIEPVMFGRDIFTLHKKYQSERISKHT